MIYLYGGTPTGSRIHLGQVVRQNATHQWVPTFCGCDMLTWSEGDRPPLSKAEDYCRNCFRTFAWHFMTDSLKSSPADTIRNVIDRAVMQRLDSLQILAMLDNIADAFELDEHLRLWIPEVQHPIRLFPRKREDHTRVGTSVQEESLPSGP